MRRRRPLLWLWIGLTAACVTQHKVEPRGYPSFTLLGMRGDGDSEFDDDDTLTAARLRWGLTKDHSAGLALSYERQRGEIGTPSTEVENDDYGLYGLFGIGEGRRLRTPVELGLAFGNYSQTNDVTQNRLEWEGVGLRGAIEPEIILVYGHDFEVSVYGGLSGTIGVADVTVASGANSVDGELTWKTAGWEYGARVQVGPVVGGIAVVSRRQDLTDDPTDVLPDFKQSFEGVLITGGVRF